MSKIEEKDKSKNTKKNQSAEEIAKIMIENMKANMNNPNFWTEKEERLQKARDEVLNKKKERSKNKD